MIWSYVNKKINRIAKGKKKNNLEYLIINGKKITNNDEISNHLNNYFGTIGNDLADKILKPKKKFILHKPIINKNSIFLSPTNTNEIRKIIISLKNKKGGNDDLHARILKHIVDYIVEPIVYIINLSIDTSTFPDHFKIAEVVPVYKAKEKYNPTNYRPISLISNLAKIFERILHNRIIKFFLKSKVIAENQYGFMKNKGTKDAIAYLTDYVVKNLDARQCTAAVMLDFSKAFDTVQHVMLLEKLEFYGIRGKSLELVKNYLTNRYQYVKVNDCKSKLKEIKIGVPQGTILGPLFFIVYINELLRLVPNVLSYADDTAVLCTEKDWATTQTAMQDYLEKINYWLNINKLSINANKTEYLTFSIYKNKQPTNFNLYIGGNELNKVKSYKYLGMHIDQHLRYDVHINYLVKKLRYLLFVFYKLKFILSNKALLSIYYGLFHSIATYGIVAWGSAYKNVTQKIYNLQNRVLKIIYSNRQNSIVNKPLSIKQTYHLNLLVMNYTNLYENFKKNMNITRKKHY